MATKFDAIGWKSRVESAGFRVNASGTIVTLSRCFTPGDNSAFVDCDMFAGGYLAELPQTTAGSTWGTDGGSVGGYAALKSGSFYLHRSGISKRVVSALTK